MKQRIMVVCFISSLCLFSACSIFKPYQGALPPMTDADALWQYITLTNPYTEWNQFDDTNGMKNGSPPHGARIQIYPNKIASRSVYQAEEGSIIVMENYDEDGTTLLTIDLMQKRPNYAPSAGNWFWASYEANGTVIEEGKIKRCVECHVSMAFGDYTFIHQW
ncbi:cytochrome P460 family protein [Halodesulfovibrio marinisediminis]|uniref:Cytochrome P460 n=1 Tax=Halodesulfovibrio marinisediminis DSM 17456 TaxID=1121457 RepID=A0A1N6F796_9BACT|nr:cytochrome P460 family protein [Halodesulfovibrio marinisediminis]SIN91178.1 Cytochrome P460 [Halodesulfovibrio marinisediminis DSM 17456]